MIPSGIEWALWMGLFFYAGAVCMARARTGRWIWHVHQEDEEDE